MPVYDYTLTFVCVEVGKLKGYSVEMTLYDSIPR